MSAPRPLDHARRALLEAHFPGEEARFFAPMIIGNTQASAQEGAGLILAGRKTATSSAPWDYVDTPPPFAGALSLLIDGRDDARAILETVRVEEIAFGALDAAFAEAYGEGDRTLAWFRREIGAWYAAQAARHGAAFSDDTVLYAEWFRLAVRL